MRVKGENTRGAVDEVRLLLTAGAIVNAKDDIGSTPLHRAIFKGDSELVELLIRHGADPFSYNIYGDRPIGHAKEGLLDAAVATVV